MFYKEYSNIPQNCPRKFALFAIVHILFMKGGLITPRIALG